MSRGRSSPRESFQHNSFQRDIRNPGSSSGHAQGRALHGNQLPAGWIHPEVTRESSRRCLSSDTALLTALSAHPTGFPSGYGPGGLDPTGIREWGSSRCLRLLPGEVILIFLTPGTLWTCTNTLFSILNPSPANSRGEFQL